MYVGANLDLIEKADRLAEAIHTGHKRRYTDEDYIWHTRRVASMAALLGLPAAYVAAALLHDTVEDHPDKITLADIGREFGFEVEEAVYRLTDQPIRDGLNRAARKAIDLDRLGNANGHTQTVKCLDLLDNTPTIVAHDPDFAVRYLPEKRAVLTRLTKADPRASAEAWRALRNAEAMLRAGKAA